MIKLWYSDHSCEQYIKRGLVAISHNELVARELTAVAIASLWLCLYALLEGRPQYFYLMLLMLLVRPPTLHFSQTAFVNHLLMKRVFQYQFTLYNSFISFLRSVRWNVSIVEWP